MSGAQAPAALEKIVVVTRRTRLEELVERFNTVGQAKFCIEHAGGDFAAYQEEADTYRRSLDFLRRTLDFGLKLQFVERSLVPTMLFTERDLVVTAGPDGLVANVAKYVGEQPVVAVNPDPERFDGVLLPFSPPQARAAVDAVLAGRFRERRVTLAEVTLNDGQHLLAFNDLFLGAATHVSARYTLHAGGRPEVQSSSGVLVSTGAGSTGWLSSVFHMAAGVARLACARSGRGDPEVPVPEPLAWEDPRLVFVVREPFESRHSQARQVAGMIDAGGALRVESHMPSGGVIFSDGVEHDFLCFNSGATATVRAADRQARLVVPARRSQVPGP